MDKPKLGKHAVTAAAVATAAGVSQAADQSAAQQAFLDKIKSDDPDVRTEAWQNPGKVGARVLRPLARLVATAEPEVSRAAKRAMWKIVRQVGAPDARAGRKKRTITVLTSLLSDKTPTVVRREVLWMLSEISGDEAVDTIAALLKHNELREDARMALDRIPGDKSLAALQAGLAEAPDDFKHNIAQSLRHRGVTVPGLPCQKLVPTKSTAVKPGNA